MKLYLSRRIRLPESDTDASKHVGVLTIYKYCSHTHTYIYIYICCACVGLDDKLYKIYSTYIKIVSKLSVNGNHTHISIIKQSADVQ